MNHPHALATVIASLCLCGGAARAADPEIKFEKYKLPNGLTVILSEDHRLPQVAVDIWYHVGAANQTTGRSGFAHLFEHMMFSGSKHIQPSPFHFLESIGTPAGAMANGTTNWDRTNYFEVVPTNELATALWIESDRMAFLLDTLDQKKLEVQRNVVSNERRQNYENRPYGMTYLRTFDLLFPAPHPYFEGVIGSIPEIQAATVDDLKAFFKQFYGPTNASLSIVGDFDPKAAKALIEKYFGPVPATSPVVRPEIVQPELTGVIRENVPDKVAEVPKLDLVWKGVKRYSDDEAAGDVLADILGGGKASRLYKSLVFDKQVASAISADSSAVGLGGWFTLEATAKTGRSVSEALPLMQAALDEIKKSGPTAAEVDRAKRKIVADLARSVERAGGFGGKADILNRYETFLGDPSWLSHDLARYRAVTPEAVQAFAKKYLRDDRRLELTTMPSLQPEPDKAGPGATAGAKAPPAAGDKAAPATSVKPAPAAAATPDAEFRASKPATAAGTLSFTAPLPIESTLKTGARLLVVENHSVPLVSIDIAILAGVDAEPAGKAGLAQFTAALLDESTKHHSSLELATALDDLAAQLSVSAELEASHLRLNCLSETLPQAMDLLVEVLTEPAFKTEDVDRVRGLLVTALQQKNASPRAAAQDQTMRLVFGDKHPLGQPSGGTPSSLQAMTGEDLKAFHSAYYQPNNAVISVSGDTTAAEMQKLVAARLGSWQGKAALRAKLPALPALKRGVVLVDKPGASQSQVWMAGRLFAANTPDAVPVAVMNNVLGGLFGSRLNLNLRENKSWSYGVRSQPQLLRTTGVLLASGGIQAPYTAEALGEYQKEIGALASGELKAGELEMAKAAIIRSLPAMLETNDSVAVSIANLAVSGRPLDYFKTLPGKVAKVTAAEVARVAKKYLVLDAMPAVVVGPKAASEEKLKGLGVGPVELRPLDQ
jgi:zinc protease